MAVAALDAVPAKANYEVLLLIVTFNQVYHSCTLIMHRSLDAGKQCQYFDNQLYLFQAELGLQLAYGTCQRGYELILQDLPQTLLIQILRSNQIFCDLRQLGFQVAWILLEGSQCFYQLAR